MNEQISLLIVDDNKDNRLVLENLIKGHFPSVEILTATSATEGMQIAFEQQVDIALVDVQMPGIDGIELCRRLKADKRTNHISFILLTSHKTVPELMVKGLDAGADDFIHRPFDNIEFVARVKVLLRIKHSEKKLREINEHLEEMVTEKTEKLRKSEERYRALYENAPLSYQSLDETGCFLDVNPAWLKILGYEKDKVIGKHFVEFLHPDFMPYFEKNFPEAKRCGYVNNVQYKIRHNDGHYLDISFEGRVGYHPDGSFRETYCFFQNITKHKQAEKERELLLYAIEQSAEIVVITNTEAEIQYVNSAFVQITGYTKEEAIGQNPRILKSGDQDNEFYKEMWATLTRGESWRGRLVNKKKDGSLYIEVAVISPVLDVLGTIVNFVAVKRDITQEIMLEKQFRQAQRMEAVGILAGGVAHDFNNMLSVIQGYTEMALKKAEPSHSLYRNLEAIRKAAERSADLIRQLLAFSRQQPLELKVININDLLTNLGDMLRRMISEDIDLKMVSTDNLDLVKADPGQIEQIVMNLAVNAQDSMPDGGKLTIETANVDLDEQYVETHFGANTGRFVLMTISDTGCGMAEETRERIFDPFFTTKGINKGTGLGLSTVYGIVKQSGGYIWCSSEPGKGTTFKIYLPRTDASMAPGAEQNVGQVCEGGEEHILMVEDEADVRHMLEAMLKELHYHVTVAESGEEAILLIEEKGLRPDLIITDVVMPGTSGKLMIDRMQKTLPEQRVLYMSGYTYDAIAHHGILDNDIDFIQKPFTLRGLAAKIEKILTGNGAKRLMDHSGREQDF